MNFQRISLLFAQLIILINLLVDIVHPVEEDCYRGELYDYDNPCYGQPGQPEKLDLCPQGHKLVQRCTESCKVCDSGTFADSFNNCPSCKPCLTECPKGQVIIRNCSSDANAECGCPLCQEHDPSTCPPVLPCICEPSTPIPAQTTDWNMSTRLMATSGPGEEQNFASCYQYWIPLAVVIIVLFLVATVIILRYVSRRKAGNQGLYLEMGNQPHKRTQQDPTRDNANLPPEHASTPAQGQAGNSNDPPIAESEDLEDGGEPSTKAGFKDPVKGEHEEKRPLLEGNSEDVNMTGMQKELGEKSDEIKQPFESQQKEKDMNEELKKRVKELEETVNKLQVKTEEKVANIEEIKGQLAEKDKKVTKLEADLKEKDEEIQLVQSKVEERQKSEEMKKKVTELEETVKNLQVENQEKCEQMKKIKSQLEEKVAKLEEDLSNKDKEIQLVQSQVEEKKQEPKNFSSQTLPRISPSQGRERNPDEEMYGTFRYLKRHLAKEWRDVGRALGLDNATLNTIQSDNKDGISETVYGVLCHWKQKNGSRATYIDLIKALEIAERTDLAEDVQNWKDPI